MAELPTYDVFALRYARRDARRAEHFLGGDPHDGPMPMDYFLWLIRGPERTIVVDSGFTAEVAARRKREFLRCPIEALRLLDVDAGAVRDVVLTHLHYDHVGNFHRFPAAEFHLQEPDLHFAVGRHMRHAQMRHVFEVEDVVGIVRLNYAGRVRLYDGVVELAPGITLHPAPGHSAALQFVRVNTRRGPVVLASDASHFYENMQAGRPFPICISVADSLDSYERVRAAAPSPDHVIPGHDPLVMQRYPAPRPDLEGIAVRLDVPPLT
ncbi:MAG: N-acyl homoserine lactonase family protein [Acetobacteraceae bacterium]|nr:N-acyl homoserine lactonase family protein [Acetobacteraceae bacterium]